MSRFRVAAYPKQNEEIGHEENDDGSLGEGRIVASLGDEKYTFQDATGSVMVEIDDDEWHGITVTPETNLEISGELDKEIFETPKIDVKSFRVLP